MPHYRVTLTTATETTESRHPDLTSAAPLVFRTLRALTSTARATTFTRELERERALFRPHVAKNDHPGAPEQAWTLTVESTPARGARCPWYRHPDGAPCLMDAHHGDSCTFGPPPAVLAFVSSGVLELEALARPPLSAV